MRQFGNEIVHGWAHRQQQKKENESDQREKFSRKKKNALLVHGLRKNPDGGANLSAGSSRASRAAKSPLENLALRQQLVALKAVPHPSHVGNRSPLAPDWFSHVLATDFQSAEEARGKETDIEAGSSFLTTVCCRKHTDKEFNHELISRVGKLRDR